MIDRLLLEGGLAYELGKCELRQAGQSMLQAIEAACDRYDATHAQSEPCTGNILCEREGVRHRKDCPGRSVPITAYVKALR